MFGFFGAINDFFAFLTSVLVLGAVSFVAGLAAGFVARMIGGLSGLGAGAVLCTAIIIGTGAMTDIGGSRDCATRMELQRLETEKRKLQQELDAEKAANTHQDVVIADQQERLEANEKVMDELEKIVDSHAGDSDCAIYADELQIIDQLR